MLREKLNKIKRQYLNPILLENKLKVFCIGLNKTGTTTLQATLQAHGLVVANQRDGELLLNDWYHRNFKAIIRYTKSAQFFQDVPFSLPYTYIILHHYYPNAKFILSVRDDEEMWYNSLIKFHSKLWADGIKIPDSVNLKNADYIEKGYAYKFNKWVYNTPKEEPYNPGILKSFYLRYNQEVRTYFKSNLDSFIEINVAKKEDYFRLCSFLRINPSYDNFLWKNKTADR